MERGFGLRLRAPRLPERGGLLSTIVRLDPPIPVWTKRGDGLAYFLIDYGQHDHHLMWVVALYDGGQVWTFENPDMRFMSNLTIDRSKDEAI